MALCTDCGSVLESGPGTSHACVVSPLRPNASTTPTSFAATDATRLLSAACYLNAPFRTSVYKRFVRNRHQAFAPDYGVDLPTVVRHCLYGRRRAFFRNLMLLGSLGLLAVLFFLLSLSVETALALLVLGAFAINFVYTWKTFSLICQHSAGSLAADLPAPPLPARLAYLADSRAGNLVVFNGFSPFAGSGFPLNAWSFVVDTGRGKEVPGGTTAQPIHFATSDLYERISDRLARLHLQGVSVEDRVYVSGQEIRGDLRFFDEERERPRPSVDPEVLAEAFASSSSLRARHYRCIRVVDWSGELVLSFFFRLRLTGDTFFVEANYRLLTPIDDIHRQLERVYKRRTFLQLLIRLGWAGIITPFYLVWAPLNIVSRAVRPITDVLTHWLKDWLIREKPTYDYGAEQSLREMAGASYSYRRHAQRLDGEMHSKVLEKCVLDSIIDFLDEHDIDTSDLKQRQTAILNSGVIISGGSIQAESIAIGKGARSLIRRLRSPRRVKAAA